MRIAVNFSASVNNSNREQTLFIVETFRRIVQDHPDHQFIFISDKSFDPQPAFGKNTNQVIIGSKGNNPITWKWWYDVKIPAALKRQKADLFVSCDGCCSLSTKISQCLVVNDAGFLCYPEFTRKTQRFFYKKYTPAFLQKAKSVAAVSGFIKNELVKNYGAISENIKIIHPAANEIFRPQSDSIKVQTKEKFTENREYFLYAGEIHPRKNLMNILKAFSIFKKSQQSNMKLVIAGNKVQGHKSVTENLKNYKYRTDVIMLNAVTDDELVRIMGAAYAFVYPSFCEPSGLAVLEAMQADVPVITAIGSAMQEIAGDAALYANPENFSDIAAHMMNLYKDEELRNRLIAKGKTVVSNFSWDKTAKLLWETIEKALD